MDNIEKILQAENKVILRLILEQMHDWQVLRIRHKLFPHWADGKYGTWSHNDCLFDKIFDKPTYIRIQTREQLTGDLSIGDVLHSKCLMCGENIISDKDYFDGRYTHLFANCNIISDIMKKSNSEEEFRKNIEVTLKNKKPSPHYYDCSIGRTGKCDCLFGN